MALHDLAREFKKITFDEMMEVAEWFSIWTTVNEKGNSQKATISRETMASNLSDWADNVLEDSDV